MYLINLIAGDIMTQNSTQAKRPHAAINLPLTLVSLDEWSLITATGADSEKYLQGQLTTDIAALPTTTHTLSAHCEAKGKMWSTLRLFHQQEGFAYILRKNVAQKQLAELKKYAVFSKVTLTENTNSVLLGLAGQGAALALANYFPNIPRKANEVVNHHNTYILQLPLPTERFLIVTDEETAKNLAVTLKAETSNSEQWLALDIEAGYPIIDTPNIEQLLPQATNLQALPLSICFKKGCYTGQEMVSRAKFRGANKRAMYLLSGGGTELPEIGGSIEWQLGEDKWRKTGTVLSAVRMADNTILTEVVMNNDMELDSVFRVQGDNISRLVIKPLPYSLEEE